MSESLIWSGRPAAGSGRPGRDSGGGRASARSLGGALVGPVGDAVGDLDRDQLHVGFDQQRLPALEAAAGTAKDAQQLIGSAGRGVDRLQVHGQGLVVALADRTSGDNHEAKLYSSSKNPPQTTKGQPTMLAQRQSGTVLIPPHAQSHI